MSDIEPPRAVQRLTGRYTRSLGTHPRFRPANRSLEDQSGDGGDPGQRPPPEDTVSLSTMARFLVANRKQPQAAPPPPPKPQTGYSAEGVGVGGTGRGGGAVDLVKAADLERQASFNESWLADQEVSALRWVVSPSVPVAKLIGAVDQALARDVPITWAAVDGFDAADVHELLSILVLHPRAPLLLVSAEAQTPEDLGEAERALLWSALDPLPIPDDWAAYAATCWLAVITDVDEADAAGLSVDQSIAALQAATPNAESLLVSLTTGRGMDRLAEWLALPRYG